MHIIANGGLSNLNDSHTIEAIMLTKNIDYIDGIKINIYKSIDNIYVVCQDNDLKKYTLSKEKVSMCTYHYLRKVKFPSHIFKYYIPTLEEILINYNKNKKIFLDIKCDDLTNLKELLQKYSYKYYFIYNSDKTKEILENNFIDIGIVCNDNFNYQDYIFTNNPIKIHKEYL